MPTLQSKYGVPGRELGAGSQAQVMLLRVKSSKKESWEQQQQRQQRMSSKNGIVVEAPQQDNNNLLSPPHFGSSTLITTTEDKVTPQQREAYRKQLLHRTSTGGLSTTENGGLIYAIKKFRPPKATETHRRYLKKVCAEFCISTSMDHENIIRTIDLVRDQPEEEWAEDDDFDADHHHQGNMRTDRQHGVDGGVGGDNGRPYHECNCPQEYRRRVRVTAKNVDEPQPSIVSMAHWKQSRDTLPSSNRHSHLMHRSHYQDQAESTFYHHYHDQQSNRSESHLAAHAKKTKQQQQLEQELRQKEVQRLKHQKQREKRLAERWRQEQFPEYCMVMEYAAGGDLFNVLTKSYPPITLKEKHCLWRQLISGVQYMHSIGVAVSGGSSLRSAFFFRS
jgi:serine/threonine protein kinase